MKIITLACELVPVGVAIVCLTAPVPRAHADVDASPIVDLIVNNAPAQGGSGSKYIIQPDRFAGGARQYLDSEATILAPIPDALRNRTFIQTAEDDKSTSAGSSDFIRFTLHRSSTVYVAHDTAIETKPRWLTANFLDTGKQISAGGLESRRLFELYAKPYPAGAKVTLGSNVAPGATPAGSMYTVVIAPTGIDTVPPTPPTALRRRCATAAVVGLEWAASTDNVEVAGYRLSRDGAVVATVPDGQTTYADIHVTPSTHYTYAVTAFDRSGNTTSSRDLHVKTARRSANGDAPYCRSSKITDLKFEFAADFSETNGNAANEPPYSDSSDLWPLTWGADGDMYTFFGDGWGLCGELDTGIGRADDDTSLGFARITGPMPPVRGPQCPQQFADGNIYGGFNSSHPYGGGKNGLLNGKAYSVIAIGSTFYALAQIWRPGDTGGPHGAPHHTELIYSLDNGGSWQVSPWSFCAVDADGNPGATGGLDGGTGICPSGFINFGPGYSGARDEYVYLYAAANTPAGAPANSTYLLRVADDQLLDTTAYQYYAGLDERARPIWSANPKQKQPVFVDSNSPQRYRNTEISVRMDMSIGEAVYDAPLGRYIAVAEGTKLGQAAFYEAPEPWGPWSVIYYANVNLAKGGTGGWGNLGAGNWDGMSFAQAESLGIHIGNAWTSADGKALWLVFSSDGRAPSNATFAHLAGNWMDSFNLVEAKLKVH